MINGGWMASCTGYRRLDLPLSSAMRVKYALTNPGATPRSPESWGFCFSSAQWFWHKGSESMSICSHGTSSVGDDSIRGRE